MPTIRVDGVDLHYEVFGQGPTILGIHGTPSSALLWEEPARRLGELGLCVVYDRRGFGRSRPFRAFASLDLEDHVDDAAALIATLEGPAVVIGRSTGGLIAVALAHLHPEKVRALVLLEAALFSIDPEADGWAAHLRQQVLVAASINPTSASEAVIEVALGEGTWDAFPPDVRALFADASPAVLAEIHGRGLDLSADPFRLTPGQLAEIRCPTLVVSADDSPRALRLVSSRIADALPAAAHRQVGGGHLIDPADPVVQGFITHVLAGP